jgi:hypothetical protein
MTSRRRFEMLSIVLRDSSAGDFGDWASDALDGLEHMARNGQCREEFLNLLRSSEAVSLVWSHADTVWARWQFSSPWGSISKERRCSVESFIAFWLRGSSAELNRLAIYRCALQNTVHRRNSMILSIGSRVAARKTCRSSVQRSMRPPVMIVVVGGDEMQARYDEDLRRTFGITDAAVTLEFHHTSWGSNWGEQFRNMKPLLDRADAAVWLCA